MRGRERRVGILLGKEAKRKKDSLTRHARAPLLSVALLAGPAATSRHSRDVLSIVVGDCTITTPPCVLALFHIYGMRPQKNGKQAVA